MRNAKNEHLHQNPSTVSQLRRVKFTPAGLTHSSQSQENQQLHDEDVPRQRYQTRQGGYPGPDTVITMFVRHVSSRSRDTGQKPDPLFRSLHCSS